MPRLHLRRPGSTARGRLAPDDHLCLALRRRQRRPLVSRLSTTAVVNACRRLSAPRAPARCSPASSPSSPSGCAGCSPGSLAFAGFALIDSVGQWDEAMETLSLVLVASPRRARARGAPGHLGGPQPTGSAPSLRPVLDFMQTMPAFVYLIPGDHVLRRRRGPRRHRHHHLRDAARRTDDRTRHPAGRRGTGRGRRGVRHHPARHPAAGPAAAGPADHHGGRQPGHHARPVHGRHRRHGRRRRPRRRRLRAPSASSTSASASRRASPSSSSPSTSTG